MSGLGRVGAVAVVMLVAAVLPAQAAHRSRAHLATSHVQTARLQTVHVATIPSRTNGDDTIEGLLLPVHAAPVGDVTRVPYGWADFCTRRVEECRVDVLDPVDVVLTPKVEKALAEINASVNAEIEPISNLEHWGTLLDHWDYPTDGKGDCKIYALWKRKHLLDAGYPRQALLMTIVRDLDGNGHTVLTVKTDKGDLVLDNMVGEVRLWDATGYQFVKRQSQNDPNVWVSVGPATMPVTTAVVN